ncbi:NIPA-like protein [Frankliniella fusca]|uniref:NIPA-like protein n=1 Tax=Frankliniella fusca TaxID=407009 RepID=A0AAE1HYM6_9NEOP|nr:NIPA-like protein [Frankliniella fusca]
MLQLTVMLTISMPSNSNFNVFTGITQPTEEQSGLLSEFDVQCYLKMKLPNIYNKCFRQLDGSSVFLFLLKFKQNLDRTWLCLPLAFNFRSLRDL